MKYEKDITVVFLMWAPYGYERFETFVLSYLQHPAGMAHELLIIFKDEDDSKPVTDSYYNLLRENNISYTALNFKGGLDIDAYLFAAKNCATSLLLFFNTSSVIVADKWLQKMYAHIIAGKTGMVSATGSWQSYRSSILYQHSWKYETGISFLANCGKYKLLLKAFFYYPFLFKSFPNPHLRTNAFMIRKDMFLALRWKPLTSKLRAYQCESGRNSITRQIINAGYEVLVIDKYGIAYKQDEWQASNTFRADQQQNLLVMDNQTRIYAEADKNQKKIYSYLAWGANE